MALRTNEHSYRSLLAALATQIVKQLTSEALMAKLGGKSEESKGLALDAFDMIQAAKWLQSLDESICPEVENATEADLHAAAERALKRAVDAINKEETK